MDPSDVCAALLQLEQEMSVDGRTREASALREAASWLGRLDRGVLTVREAAVSLGLSERAIEEWIGRGGLDAVNIGARWFVSAEQIASLTKVRETLLEMDRDGNPADQEIQALYARSSGLT